MRSAGLHGAVPPYVRLSVAADHVDSWAGLRQSER